MNLNNKSIILITCAQGITPYLEIELKNLGYNIISSHDTGVELEGNISDTMVLNLNLRTAYNVLYLVKKFNCYDPEDLYKTVYNFSWEEIIDSEEYISVVSSVDTAKINNSLFVSYKVKDAIVDRIRDKTGVRPNAGPERENVVINFYWKKDQAWLYINTSGKKLADRGYRKFPHTAPLQETLAAAILMAVNYNPDKPLVLPMCGSATLAIEAALMALDYAPGLMRENFGFMHIKCFDPNLWQKLCDKAREKVKKTIANKIIATDIDQSAIYAAKKNATQAFVSEYIEFKTCDFFATPIPEDKGIVIVNPEYGCRLGQIKELEITYKQLGDFFKQKCFGYDAYIFSGNMDLLKKVGLRSKQRLIFFNAQIECRLVKYPLWEKIL